MENFLVVIFKNKRKKKIIKGYVSRKYAESKYNNLINSNDVPFEMVYENGVECNYEIALLSKSSNSKASLFKSDEFGRNKEVFIEDSDEYEILKISDYKIEELIYDCQVNKRISFESFLKNYFNKKEIKVVSTLHNKIVIQIDTEFYLFRLKNITDSNRFISVLENLFISINRTDTIFVRDNSTIQRKWMYNQLVEYGFNKNQLYRQVTTYPK